MRTAYLLTCDSNSPRAIHSFTLLQKIGFDVIFVNAIKNSDKVLSNKLSMISIYNTIINNNDNDDSWYYIFEDDINIIEPISIDEIILYEDIASQFFYLGVCKYHEEKILLHESTINNKPVYIMTDNVRGLHAIGISKIGAKNLTHFSQYYEKEPYMDKILEEFSRIIHPLCVRYDLQSMIYGHRGIFFQDRFSFPSSIS